MIEHDECLKSCCASMAPLLGRLTTEDVKDVEHGHEKSQAAIGQEIRGVVSTEHASIVILIHGSWAIHGRVIHVCVQ